jgi:hypothetical protein
MGFANLDMEVRPYWRITPQEAVSMARRQKMAKRPNPQKQSLGSDLEQSKNAALNSLAPRIRFIG